MADKRRRKSLSIFRQKTEVLSGPSPPASPMIEKLIEDHQMPSQVQHEPESPKIRPRTLQKSNRASVFGSLRSLNALDEDEKMALTRSESKSSSAHEEHETQHKGFLGKRVLLHGDVQLGGSNMFRKRSQYVVLTETHLIRFRSQSKAVEMFPTITPSSRRASTSRVSSAASGHELHMAAHSDILSGVPLDQVVAVYALDDGRPFFTVEVAHLDERVKRASAFQLQFSEPREAEQWTRSIRDSADKARQRHQKQFQKSTLEYIARLLEQDRDYDPDHFQLFKVVQRASSKPGGRSSSDDLTKLNSAICYFAIGLHKVHFIPLTREPNRAMPGSPNDLESPLSFGITTLTAVKIQADEDAFQLLFKSPLQPPYVAHLASAMASDIALWLRYASEYLRPEWIRQPFVFDVPKELDDQMNPPDFPQEDHNCFDRTLIAYCAGYDVDTSRICYSVDYFCEDAPAFQLLPPSDSSAYSALELLGVFRALRYNESFTTLSFADIDISPLRFLFDGYASDVDGLYTRSGTLVGITGHHDMPVLCQEVRALALKSRRLRRLIFSHSMPQLSRSHVESQDCGIPEALAPLCKKSLTNVDWVVLTGVQLSDSDVNFLVDAASERACHLRALEIGECGLSVHDIDVLLSTLSVQENTLEVIDISGAQGRFSPELFQREIGVFSHIRRLNLTRVQKTAGPEPLIAPETLLNWKLEALYISQTTLNEQTVDSISAYLASPRSSILHEFYLNQCGLSGRDLAVFFRSMTHEPGKAREIHLSASENRLRIGNNLLFETIGQGYGPSSLTMRMMDFEKEHQFRELIEALTSNKTIRSLDISRASLPYDVSNETCEALKDMFATNTTLEELDMSGEHAHLDATRFGIGLNIALRGLENNKTLKVLRIEHQSLGLQGANTLAGVLETNETLLEIYCEHNDINLQSFTVLVNALEKNKTLLSLPNFEADRARSIDKIRQEAKSLDKNSVSRSPKPSGTVRRSFTDALSSKAYRPGHRQSNSVSSTLSHSGYDVALAFIALDEKWDHQVNRMREYLFRNYCLAHGMSADGEKLGDSGHDQRPPTARSFGKMFDRTKLDRPSPVVRNLSPDYMDEKSAVERPLVVQMTKE